MRKNIVKSVKAKLEEDACLAKAIIVGLSASDRKDHKRAVRKLFPELDKVPGGMWSNLPQGTSLAHYVLLGIPVILDLEPLEKKKFKEKHGFTVEAIEELVDLGRILPNLYVRNPDEWAGKSHLSGLVNRSIANGERTDQFINFLHPGFSDLKDHQGRKDKVRKAIQDCDSFEEIRKITKQDALRHQVKAISHQWAYISAFLPDVSADFEDLVDGKELLEALKLSRVMRRAYISPLTASLGGELVWGSYDVDLWTSFGSLLAPEKKFSELEHLVGGVIPEAFQFLVEELTNLPEIKIIERIDVRDVVHLHRRKDWPMLKGKVFELLRDLTRAAKAGKSIGSGMVTLRETLAEQESILKSCDRSGTMVEKVAIPLASIKLGMMFSMPVGAENSPLPNHSILGALAGGIVGLCGGSARFSSWAHKLQYPLEHRIFANLKDIKSAMNKAGPLPR